MLLDGCGRVPAARILLQSVHPLRQGPGELVGIQGLGQVVVHAGLEADVSIPLHRVGGESDDGHVPAAGGLGLGPLPLADDRRRLIAVHDRHLAVHQDEIRPSRLDRLDGLASVDGVEAREAQFGDHLAGDLAVDLVVLHQQDHPASLFLAGPGHRRGSGRASAGTRRQMAVGRGHHGVVQLGHAGRFGERGREQRDHRPPPRPAIVPKLLSRTRPVRCRTGSSLIRRAMVTPSTPGIFQSRMATWNGAPSRAATRRASSPRAASEATCGDTLPGSDVLGDDAQRRLAIIDNEDAQPLQAAGGRRVRGRRRPPPS